MKTLTTILLLAVSYVSTAQSQITAEASLESVTVYTRGTEMNHKAKVSLPAGSSEVLIRNVANVLDENSIRIGANANVTILSVSFSRDYLKPKTKSAAYLRLEDSVKTLNKYLVTISNERQTEESLLQVLAQNGTIAGTNTTVTVTELEKMLDYYARKQEDVKKRLAALSEKEEGYTQRIGLLQQQMQEMTAGKEENKGQLVVQVMARTAASSDFTISYTSPNAAWTAFYDLRAESTSEPLKLAYKANITQSTGIDWKKVKLTLATGSPSQNGMAPALSTWFLRYHAMEGQQYGANALEDVTINGRKMDKRGYTGALSTVTAKDIAQRPVTDIVQAIDGTASGVLVSAGGGQPGASPDIRMRGVGAIAGSSSPMILVDGSPYSGSLSSLNADEVASMNVLKGAEATNLYGSRGSNGVIVIKTKNKNLSSYTTTTDGELNASFNVELPYDIASNDRPHSVSLQEYKVPASYHYYAAPKSSTEAFLTAEITGYEQLNLLPGNANIILEGMYIGKSTLNPAITTDTLNLSMGADRRIVIKREKVAELSGVKMIGSSRKQTYTYEIKVRNGKKEAISLQLKDQYPIATDKDMEIELLEASKAGVDKESGILSWDIKLAPGETKTLRLSYSVKYPRARLLANL